MVPPVNQPWRPPAPSAPSPSTTLPLPRKPPPPQPPLPMFAYAGLPRKPDVREPGRATPPSLPRRPDGSSGPSNGEKGDKSGDAKVAARAEGGVSAAHAFLPSKPAFSAPHSASTTFLHPHPPTSSTIPPKSTSPTAPAAAAGRRSPTPTPGPGAMVPYDAYTFTDTARSSSSSNGARPLPGVAGTADISIWSKPLREHERFERWDTHKRARSEDDDTPATPFSLSARSVVVPTLQMHDPDAPVPVLPPPLPSKRAKRGGASTAVLLPVEKLPVFPLPPPPPIADPALLRQVFTHQSAFPRSRGLFDGPADQGHYEKLEHVGDSILGMVVTTWLHELKPGLTCGTATVGCLSRGVANAKKLKAHLVSNATLSHISGMYNFPQRLNGDARLLPVLRAQTDVRAALVEAYIAGVYFSFPAETRMVEGIKCVTAWLREMYDPLYDFFLQHMEREYAQHYSVMGTSYDGTVQVAASPEELERLDAVAEGMALLLKMYGAQRERTVEYESERFETSVGILWRMRCSVDGIEMGDATRPSRYRARNAAAWEAAKKLGLAPS